MLPRKHRLTGRRAVERVYQIGSRQGGQFLFLRQVANRSNTPRVAVVVATAVSKKATQRNRAKRVIRAILKDLRLPAADLVVSVRHLPPDNWYQFFRKDLVRWFPER